MMDVAKKLGNSSGFTIIESLMAISILAIVAVQILNVQSASITVTQSSRDNMRATWAMRSAISQMEYALDTVGPKGLPKEASFPWALDPQFTISVKVEDTPLEASRLLFTAMKMGGAAGAAQSGAEGEESEDKTGGMKEIGAMLDSQIPKDMYRTANFSVSWKEGEGTRSLDGGMLTIDTSMLNGFGDPSKLIPGGGSLPDVSNNEKEEPTKETPPVKQ